MTINVLVTGSNGFVGRNLMSVLGQRPGYTAVGFDVSDDQTLLSDLVLSADVIVHLAGVNRPPRIEDYQQGNARLTEQVIKVLDDGQRITPIILSSSTQAAKENAYGLSKRDAENAVFAYGQRTGAHTYVYRLPNLFGKWCRPNYNSAVATFCHNIARDLPVEINDPTVELDLVYIDDLMNEFVRAIDGCASQDGAYCQVPVVHKATVQELVDRIRAFRSIREVLSLPNFKDPLSRKLHSTYLANLPEDAFAYSLKTHTDPRGSFTEFLRTPERGQVSVNISKPGITKGNHWHHTKTEKFLVVSGFATICFRKVGTQDVITYQVSSEKLEVVDIPPGYTHAITNTGVGDLVTIMWVNEAYDPNQPDTWFEKV